jgi:adenosine deaminase
MAMAHPGWETHPIRRFVDEKISCSINSDDPVTWQMLRATVLSSTELIS